MPIDKLLVRVVNVHLEAEGIRSLRLATASGDQLPSFTPGAHIRVHGRRADGQPAVRAYSLVNDPVVQEHYDIGVLREGDNGVSGWLHSLHVGDEITIERPRNDFPLAPHASQHVLIGGGIGLTPLLSMASLLARQSARFKLWVLVRSPGRLPFGERLQALPAGAVQVHASRLAGRFDLNRALAGVDSLCHVYVCGPRSLIEAVRATADALGTFAGHVHEEHFDAGADRRNDHSFDVELRVSRIHLRVEPGQSILDRMEEAGIFHSYDCRRGECGTCLARVLEGIPDHRDSVQTLAEKATNEFMTICCSRALTERLVLDL